MNSKIVMTVMAIITGLVGLSFIIFHNQITTRLFPTVGEEAIMVGDFHRQMLGGAVLVFSIYFWFMRGAEEVIAKRHLFASSICFSVQVLILIKASVIDGAVALPLPPFILLIILALASFYFSKKESSNTDQ